MYSYTIEVKGKDIIYRGYKINIEAYDSKHIYFKADAIVYEFTDLEECLETIDNVQSTKNNEINRSIVLRGKKIKCVEDTEEEVLYSGESTCNKCCFKKYEYYCPIKCQDFEREDGKFVHFEEVE